jgi:hypothetical protein
MAAKIKSQTHHRHKHKPKGINKHAFEKVYWPYIPFLAVALILLITSARSGLASAWFKNPKAVLSYATSVNDQDLLSDTNQARQSAGQKTLKLNAELTKAAQAKANDMALRNYWSHNTPAGNPPWTFVTATGYTYQKLGENLAAGFADSQSTIDGWLASPEHKENMLDSGYSEAGFGFANNPNYTSTGNSGPMTIVVAFYGTPETSAISLDKNSNSVLALAASDLSSQPPASASRAQLALAGLPLAKYSTMIASLSIFALAALWLHRHAMAMRRAFVSGERFMITHPLTDAVFVALLAFIFFIFSRSAGVALPYNYVG